MQPGLPPVFRVGLIYSFTYHAQPEEIPGKGWVTPRFAAGAFDSSIGKVIPLKLETRPAGHVRVLKADVAPDGASVEFTYEIRDLEPTRVLRDVTLQWLSLDTEPGPYGTIPEAAEDEEET